MADHSSDPNHQVNFETFFNGWLIRQQNLFDQLLLATTPENINRSEQHQTLIDQVLAHYQQYYEKKSLAAKEDAFLFLSPPWFTSFEKTFVWIGGFKPSLVFKLLHRSVKDLTEEQQKRMELLEAETIREERELTETMAMIQENIASPPLLILARRAQNLVDGEASSEAETAMETLQTGLLVTLEAADGLRGTTVRKVLQILCPTQTIKLLAGAAEFHLRVRRSGMEWDQRRISRDS